jgi:hypothetical protein
MTTNNLITDDNIDERCQQQLELLHAEIRNLQQQVSDSEELLALADEINREKEEECSALLKDNSKKDAEIKRLQQALFNQAENSCDSCEKQNSADCPGPDLCGKKILYVGGMHKLVQHYRKMVEEKGGSFMHHDGGKEIAKSRLPNMINQADAVLCPIDCVSHDACLSVKKYCKQSHKQYLMMRGSGLSSLARSLEKIS